MRRLPLAVFVMSFLMAACHGHSVQPGDSSVYPHVRAGSDLTISWKTDKGDDAIAISGLVKNNYYPYVTALKLTASLLNEEGKILSEATYAFVSSPIPLGQARPFTLKVPVNAGERPVKIRFMYRYNEFGGGYIKERDFTIFDENLP